MGDWSNPSLASHHISDLGGRKANEMKSGWEVHKWKKELGLQWSERMVTTPKVS